MNGTASERRVSRHSIQTAEDWMEWSGIALADVLNEDETPGLLLGAVGFTRAPKGARSDFDFPYDEALVVTRGRCTIESGGRAQTARAGEVLYLPAGVPGAFIADEDVELVYVASTPYGAVNRTMKASLLKVARERPDRPAGSTAS